MSEREMQHGPLPREPAWSLARRVALVVLLGLGGCQSPIEQAATDDLATQWPEFTLPSETAQASSEIGAVEEQPAESGGLTGPALYPGTGSFAAAGGRQGSDTAVGDIILNFENVGLAEFVQNVLGETLGLNYTLDPRIAGTVSLRTTQPISRDAVLATVETVLRQSGGALVADGDIYRIVPVDEAVRGQASPELAGEGGPIRPGYGILVVPLRFIAAEQMSSILEPMLPPEGVIRIDANRNLLVLAGTAPELTNLQDMVRIFDVDWLAGMSAGLIPLRNVDAAVAAEELQIVFGDPIAGPIAGLIRFVPVKRLNAILVVSQSPAYLAEAEAWIERLDRGVEAKESLYVYYVQNGKAKDLADILGRLFDKGTPARKPDLRSEVAFGLEPVSVSTQESFSAEQTLSIQQDDQSYAEPSAVDTPEPLVPAANALARTDGALSVPDGGGIRIIADEVNNALLVLATPDEYRMIEAALRKLDIVPLQVLVDATIADVTLNDELSYGVQYFLSSGGHGVTFSDGASDTAARTGVIAASFPNFAYSFVTGDRSVQVVLEALDSVTDVNVISSPRIMVLDNQTARLQVGDEVPITIQQQQSTGTGANIVNSIQFRNTGVIVEVTPRVNSGGLVTLDIKQEVSNVSATTAAGSLTPTITQRKIESSIAVQSGDTVVLGGLIQENRTKTQSGLPVLSSLPLFGPLFGIQSDKVTRSELIILLTPRVIRGSEDALAITEELRQRVEELQP